MADAPQRAACLHLKCPTSRTLKPCTMCNVTQSQEEATCGGDLGDPNYDIERNRRTRREIEESRAEIDRAAAHESATSARELSRDLGVVGTSLPYQLSALYDRVHVHQPTDTCPPELLHLNHLVRRLVTRPCTCHPRRRGRNEEYGCSSNRDRRRSTIGIRRSGWHIV